MRYLCTACAIALLSTSSFAALVNPVLTENGSLSGIAGRDARITVFKGIPYAEPPVGNLRWTAPRAPQNWKGVRKADQFSDGCVQVFPTGNFPKSEDCLYLNVWTPAESTDAALPVLVWIHGGGLRVGSSREAIYDGEELAKKGVVVVTLNYRLDVLGFFAHPELTKESSHKGSGNYGLLDQVAALKWVQRNIAAFGGDPKKVTIAGQSAGAYSVSAHVASPLSKGLFRAAIAQSVRANFLSPGMPSLAESEKAGVEFAKAAGASSLAQLRAIPADKLLQTNRSPEAGAGNVDGWFFPEDTASIYGGSKHNKVPMIIGSTSDEGQRAFRTPLSASEYVAQARETYGKDADKFLSLYPSESDDAAKESRQREFSDLVAAGEVKLANHVVKSGQTVFSYYFSYIDGGNNYDNEVPSQGLRLGTDHGEELTYMFGVLNHWDKAPVPADDRKLQDTVMAYWTNFTKVLDPNGPNLPLWKPFTGSDNSVMVLDKNVGMQPHPRAAQIEFLLAHPVD